eukprot:TRINITY_DN56774_c0_g1_i1.p1 TRINITY_DN56774_c0_g1~~TRINITY_DN56774_c0_g1_i1.p1  ORF type:complete len:731 (-),score=123.52 TRINITY_DN56774_c0_g1_i1:78-2270(-)
MQPVYLQRDCKPRRSRLASVQEEVISDFGALGQSVPSESRHGMRARSVSAESFDLFAPSARAKRKNTTLLAAMNCRTPRGQASGEDSPSTVEEGHVSDGRIVWPEDPSPQGRPGIPHRSVTFNFEELVNCRLRQQSESQPTLPRTRALTVDLKNHLEHQFNNFDEDDSSPPLQATDLRGMGFTVEDLSRVVYDKFKDQDMPDFLDYISLEVQGGLHRIEDPSGQKYFWFFVLVASVLFNMGYLISTDWNIFETYLACVLGHWDINNIAGRIADAGGQVSRAHIQEMLFDDPTFKGNLFGMISDHPTRLVIVNAAAMVAIWEVVWIILKFLHCLYILWEVCTDESEYKRYHAINIFFGKMLPQASTFSAIKLMARVHPSLVYQEYLEWVSESKEARTTSGYLMTTVAFILTRAFCAAAATAAFAVKVLAVSLKMMNSSYSMAFRLGSVLALLNQVMGCVVIESIVQDRLFLFVFGGQDSNYEDHELAYKNVYETRVVKHILKHYWQEERRFSAIVLLATFDHFDLQRLLIEENEEVQLADKLGVSGGIRCPRTSSEPTLIARSQLPLLDAPPIQRRATHHLTLRSTASQSQASEGIVRLGSEGIMRQDAVSTGQASASARSEDGEDWGEMNEEDQHSECLSEYQEPDQEPIHEMPFLAAEGAQGREASREPLLSAVGQSRSGSQPRSAWAAWGDGWSDDGLPLSRCGTGNLSLDDEIEQTLFAPKPNPAGL